MKLLILAAGYATRLYPLTKNQPKPLLPVAGKPMIEHVIDRVTPMGGIDTVYVVTNEKFSTHFSEWAAEYAGRGDFEIKVINDKSTNDDDKLGAIGDLHYVMKQEQVDDDLVVVAGDNLFSEDLTDFGEACRAKNAPILGIFDVGSLDEAKKYGAVDIRDDGKLLEFVEKPENPATSLIGIALYYYPKAILAKIDEYIAAGNNPDQPGRLVQWLCPQLDVFTWQVPGEWYDIGSKETLEEADKIFSAKQ